MHVKANLDFVQEYNQSRMKISGMSAVENHSTVNPWWGSWALLSLSRNNFKATKVDSQLSWGEFRDWTILLLVDNYISTQLSW